MSDTNPSWQEFIDTAGLHDETSVSNPDTSFIVNLNPLGVLTVSGEQAAEFLQGQLTNDIERSTATRAQLSAWCSSKGRVLMSVWLFQQAGGYCLLSATPLDAKLVARFKLYVLRAKVQVEYPGTNLHRIGCSGTQAEAALTAHWGSTPQRIGEVQQHADGVAVLRSFGDIPRFELIGPEDSIRAVYTSMVSVCSVADISHWYDQDLAAGLPLVHADTADEYVPQMLNLLELGAINFDKGCYVGQEIVARLHYRGKLKRRLYTATCDVGSAPQRGADICVRDGDTTRVSGKVLAVGRAADGACRIQAVVNIDDAEAHPLELSDGTGLRLETPSYIVDTE